MDDPRCGARRAGRAPGTGKVPGSGRKKGTPNKVPAASKLAADALLAKDQSPLEYMLGVMRNKTAPPKLRLNAARAAAPYCHRVLKAVEVTGPEGGPVQYEVVLSFE